MSRLRWHLRLGGVDRRAAPAAAEFVADAGHSEVEGCIGIGQHRGFAAAGMGATDVVAIGRLGPCSRVASWRFKVVQGAGASTSAAL